MGALEPERVVLTSSNFDRLWTRLRRARGKIGLIDFLRTAKVLNTPAPWDYENPPIRISDSGTAHAEPGDILRSRVGQRRIRSTFELFMDLDVTETMEIPSAPDELIQELGEAYREYKIEIRELINTAYFCGYSAGCLANTKISKKKR